MEVIVGALSATTLAQLMVAIFKFAVPSAQSKVIAAIAFLCGQLSAIVVQAAGLGVSTSQKVIATMFASGILATAAAMGIRAADQSAESKRTGTDVQVQREVTAELGAVQEKKAKEDVHENAE